MLRDRKENERMPFVLLAIAVVMIVGMWKVFTKAGQPGWAVLIPIYNTYVMLKIAGKPWWWLLVIMFVPLVGLIFAIMAIAALAKQFGKGAGFAVGLILLPFVFWPMLGFGSAQYTPVPAAA
jgi:ABC-type sulfate transport system permease subunit